jgi:cyanophycinase
MKTPRGKLVLIGGNEAKDENDQNKNSEQINDFAHGILIEVIKETGKANPTIEILPFASKKQEEMEEMYRESFANLGHDVGVIKIKSNEDIDRDNFLNRLKKADAIFMTGGDQVLLMEILLGTKFHEIIKQRYQDDNFVIAGTSAGAMVISDFMIDSGYNDESLLKGTVDLTHGLGLMPDVVIDTHFLGRGRFSRLAEALLLKRSFTGIGICEDTAVVVYNGNELKAIGAGTVMIIEISSLKNTNYDNIDYREPIFMENLTIHILARGAGYSLNEKQLRLSVESEV